LRKNRTRIQGGVGRLFLVLFWWRAAFEFHLLRCFFSTAGVGLPKFVLGSSDFEAVLF
jgi:hypothetical protein